MAQLVERLLPTPEIFGSNLVISKLRTFVYSQLSKDENKEKEAGNGPLKTFL